MQTIAHSGPDVQIIKTYSLGAESQYEVENHRLNPVLSYIPSKQINTGLIKKMLLNGVISLGGLVTDG